MSNIMKKGLSLEQHLFYGRLLHCVECILQDTYSAFAAHVSVEGGGGNRNRLENALKHIDQIKGKVDNISMRDFPELPDSGAYYGLACRFDGSRETCSIHCFLKSNEAPYTRFRNFSVSTKLQSPDMTMPPQLR